jgi:hypothetical protein
MKLVILLTRNTENEFAKKIHREIGIGGNINVTLTFMNSNTGVRIHLEKSDIKARF